MPDRTFRTDGGMSLDAAHPAPALAVILAFIVGLIVGQLTALHPPTRAAASAPPPNPRRLF